MRVPAFLSILLFFVAVSFASAQSASEAGDQYFKGYLLKNDAERMEQAGDVQGAVQKYQEAARIISSVAQNYPAWQPEVVSYRLKMIEAALQRLSSRVMPAPSVAVPSVPTTAVPQTIPGSTPPAPQLNYNAIPNPVAPGAPGSGPANPIDLINKQFVEQQKVIDDLRSKLGLYERGYTNALQEKDKVTQEKELLTRQSTDLVARMGAIERDANAKTSKSQQDLAKLRDEYKMVKDMLDSHDKQLSDKDQTIASLEKEKAALVDKQKHTEEEFAAAKKAQQAPKEELDKLMAENTRLKKELETTREQVVALKQSGEKKDTEIATLKSQIGGIQGELVKLRQENTAYQGQVAELTTKLKDFDAQLAQAAKASKSPANGKLVEENEALRNIILRQLRQQERQRQAKELVIAEMKKMENSSQQLMENLETMTSAKVVITMDEERFFSEKELQEIALATGPRAMLTATSGKQHPAESSESPAPPKPAENVAGVNNDEIAKLIQDAAKAAATGNYKGAELTYQDVLRADPKNLTALLSLSIIKRVQHQYDDAKVLLQKCLVYDPDNEQALYQLGICHFQQSQFPEAMSSFEKSLTQNPKSARVHHYIGIVASHMGNRDRAEAEFKQSLAIDPAYGDAHFNLAVLYATADPPNWGLAREHYQSALSRGIKADADLEKLLKQATGPSTAAIH